MKQFEEAYSQIVEIFLQKNEFASCTVLRFLVILHL